MGFLNSLFGPRIETKAVAAERSTRGGIARATSGTRSFYSPGVAMGSPGGMDIDKAVTNAYEKVVYVFKCVDTIAQNQADVPILLRTNRDRENGEIVEDRRISDLLNVRANTYETSWAFRYRLSTQLLLSRRGAFVEVLNGRDGRPSALHLLPAGRTEPIPDPENFVSGYQIRRTTGEVEVVEPERVIWIKAKPHPTDPYLQMTPLVAAGLASDTDVLARQFNYNFLANDGRPGMLITLGELADDDDVEEIRRRFSGGPQGAGRTTVIEAAGMEVQDLSGSPRDSQWMEMISGAKDDILLAFGVPESVMGNASGRTFSNADAEYENFWVHTEVPHCNVIASAFEPLLDGLPRNTIPAFDFDTIDVLQAAKARKREEWRDEFQMGLRTADSYFELTGQKVWNVPGTQVLRIGGTVVAPDEDMQDYMDNKFVDNLPNVDVTLPVMAPRQVTQYPEGTGPRQEAPRISTTANRARELAQRLTQPSPRSTGAVEDAVIVGEGGSGKAQPVSRVSVDEWHDLAGFIDGALETWHGQQTKVYTDRINHVKFRKGTRYWEDENGKPLTDEKAVHVVAGEYVVNTDEWAESIVETLRPRLQRAAKRRARAGALEMGKMGILDKLPIPRRGTPIQRMFPTEADLDAVVSSHIANAERIIRTAAMNQGERLVRDIETLYRSGGTVKDMDKMIRSYIGARSDWRKQMAEQMTTTVLEGVQEQVWRSGADFVAKTWNTRHDERVRFDHSTADGQTVMAYEQFLVGGERLMHPGDSAGSPGNVINCFPPDTRVDYSKVNGAYKRYYKGDLIEVTTREGKKVTGTPNHPVLTDKGWVALGALVEGDNVITDGKEVNPVLNHHENGSQPTISEVYSSLAESEMPMRVHGERLNFHGEIPDGDVDVVLPDGFLWDDRETPADKFISNLLFPSSDSYPSAGMGLRASSEGGVGVFGPAPGVVGGGSTSLTGLGGASSGLGDVGLGLATGGNTIAFEPFVEGEPTDPKFFSKSVLGLTLDVAVDQVVGVKRVPYAGHVYNLSTKTGAYVADGIISHNCRCYLTYGPQESQASETMDNINPTGSIFVEYAPEARAATELADNLNTYASVLELSDDEMVTVYRGVPGGTQTEIAPGDFITTNRQLAEDYAGTGDVVGQQVRAADILTDIDEVDGEEYIYRPRRRR